MMRISEVVRVSCKKLTHAFNELDEVRGFSAFTGMLAVVSANLYSGFAAFG